MEKVQNKQVFSLDIGTRSIIGSVGHKGVNGGLIVEAVCIKEHETRAMLDGQIHDIDKVVETIKEVKNELEIQVGYELKNVCIAAAGRVLKTVNISITNEFTEDTVISDENVYSLEVAAANKAYVELRKELKEEESNFYLVGYSPVRYYLNGYCMSKLNGHKSKKIGVDLLATFLPAEVIEDLYMAVERADLNVINLTLEPIAAIDVAIPEKFRLLNIALVDVGAGTSDICITKDGTIIAYGMIPCAGDEITEYISKKYLIDFNEAERIKVSANNCDKIIYEDIMGIKHTVTKENFFKDIDEGFKTVTKKIAEKILELNFGKTTSAVFVVGGGGKINGFVKSLSKYLGLAEDRVALRGTQVLNDVNFLQNGIEKDSILVTPIGIIQNYYEKHSNFVQVTANDSKIKIFDNKSLTVLDVALYLGLSNEELFPYRGKTLEFTLNGEVRSIKGGLGESSRIVLNGRIANLKTAIKQDDVIYIRPAVTGLSAKRKIADLKEYNPMINFIIDGKEIQFMRKIYVNNESVLDGYDIKNGDIIEICNTYTARELLEHLECEKNYILMLKGEYLDDDAIINEKEKLALTKKESFVYNKERKSMYKENFNRKNNSEQLKGLNILEYNIKSEDESQKKAILLNEGLYKSTNNFEETGSDISQNIHVAVNGQQVTLSKKSSYIFVDILDVYPFDTSKMKGEKLIMNVNKQKADFTTSIKDQDVVELYWA